MLNQYGVPTLPLAGFWRRFGALLIDAIIVGVASFVVRVIFAHGAAGTTLAFLIEFVGAIAYYTWGYGVGQTIGCRALNIRIVDQTTHGLPGYSKGVGRYFAGILSGLAFGLGFLWMLWDANKQTWHDKLAGTLVVDDSAVPASTTTYGSRSNL